MEADFWAPRASFQTPIPEVRRAADLVALAAESLLKHNEAEARSYLSQADMPVLRAYMRSIASQVTREIHRFREVAGLAGTVPSTERGSRQPSSAIAREIYRRDGFHCRYCGCRIICPKAESVISALLPGAVRWGTKDTELNAAFYTLKGVLDHVDPHAHGGTSEPENLVVACQPCNYGKGSGFIQQFGIGDPRLRPPQINDWDGLQRVLTMQRGKIFKTLQHTHENGRTETGILQSTKLKPFNSIDDFASTFSTTDRHHLDVLLQVLSSYDDLGVYWTLGRVLLVKIQIGGEVINALGIEPDTTLQIPWSIGPHKKAFRLFAEYLAAGVPDFKVRETDKLWCVRYLDRFPKLAELMENPEALRPAFDALRHNMSNPAYRV